MTKILTTALIIILVPAIVHAADIGQSTNCALQTKATLVAIDPGFGGDRTGPSGCDSKIYAKDINLQIAQKVAERLKKELGINVMLTRDTDFDVPLEERCASANMKNADLFLSISTNGSENSLASGIETYFLDLASNSDATRIAARQNETNKKNIADMQLILSDLMENTKVSDSDLLAYNVQGHLYQTLQRSNRAIKNRGTKKAPFYVLIGAQMPVILVSPGFITNPKECNLLSSEEYQEDISIGIVEGVRAFMKAKSTQHSPSAGR